MAVGLFIVRFWRSSTISILEFLVLSTLLGGCRLPCLGSFTRGLDGSGLPDMDRLLNRLQVHDLVRAPVEFLQRFAFILLEFIPEGCLRPHY